MSSCVLATLEGSCGNSFSKSNTRWKTPDEIYQICNVGIQSGNHEKRCFKASPGRKNCTGEETGTSPTSKIQQTFVIRLCDFCVWLLAVMFSSFSCFDIILYDFTSDLQNVAIFEPICAETWLILDHQEKMGSNREKIERGKKTQQVTFGET